jgi:transketolase
LTQALDHPVDVAATPSVQPADIARLRRAARGVRRQVLELSYHAKSGHIGSSLSCVDLLVALYESFLRVDPDAPSSPHRDRFLLSKGHACVPFYACLERRGFLSSKTLETYGRDGGPLGHHPHRRVEWGIDVSSGSLGHGLPVGAGLAYGALLQRSAFRTVVLMSDGEQNEGSVWEAAMFAAHHRLDNLLAVVDVNKLQALGASREILTLEPLHERYRAFGWAVRRIDGHDLEQIVRTLDEVPFVPGKPSAIIADTVKGKGVSFMENQLLWHYRCPDADEYARALRELDHA